MKKGNHKKRLLSLISIVISIFVYTGTIGIYFYANGWRLGNGNELFIKTGVLTVESNPNLANLYIEGKEKGRTPKSVSLPIGEYEISVYKSGYTQWKKMVEVKEQKSTPVFPWLIKEDIKKEELFSLQGKRYINSWISEYDTHIYFLVNEYIPESLVYRYSLYRFDTNTAFWNIGSNPRIVLTFDLLTQPSVEILLSPNGLLGILTIVDTQYTNYYLLDSTKSSTLETLLELDLSIFSSYQMSWSKNNQYLMFESNEDLISFDITKQTRYLLLKKFPDKKFLWNTDEQGFFYKIEENFENTTDTVYAYTLIQEQMDGSSPKTLVSDLFFQKNQDYILRYIQDTGSGKYAPFTNSTVSTKSVGEIKDFVVNQDAKGIYIGTNISSYWYNIGTGKYHLISPYLSKLIQFSPDDSKLIFKDSQGYSVFTFLKDESDHTVEIGAKQIKGLGIDTVDVNWLYNSLNVWYIKEKSMYIADINGDNESKILDYTDRNLSQTITLSDQKVVTLSLGEEVETGVRDITINSFTIH